MAGTIAKGREATKEALAKSKEGSFKPFCRPIYWKEDGEEHHVLILTDIEEIPQFEMIQFIPDAESEKIFHEVVAKTDQYFEEKKDAYVEKWDGRVALRKVAIAVELEPIIEIVKGRERPTGFEVATEEYTRRIVDEDTGELTDEEEEVVAPVIGYISQSPTNFWAGIENYDADDAPINETAVKITRIGKDKHTNYRLTGYPEQEVDLSNLVEFFDGISYLKDELDAIEAGLEAEESDLESAKLIATYMLEKRVAELLDDERYQELLEGVTESMDRFGGGKKKKKESRKGQVKRGQRSSQRRAAKEDEPDESEGEVAPEDSEPEEKPARKTRRRSAAKEETPAEDGSMSDIRARAAEARRRKERKAA